VTNAPLQYFAADIRLDKGIAKIGKALGISYAEACVSLSPHTCYDKQLRRDAQTGFEFKKQRAIPVITGIVVAEENETLVMDVSRLLIK